MVPTAVETWQSIKLAGGYQAMQAFEKVWYQKRKLKQKEEVPLRQLFEKYPLGQSNFNVWLKQVLRQLFEKVLAEERKASSLLQKVG